MGYVNNLLITSPTEITELSNMSVWWICQENSDHRYKIQVKERMAYRKRNKKECSICKGYRRKQEHFIQFKKDIKYKNTLSNIKWFLYCQNVHLKNFSFHLNKVHFRLN